MGTQLKKFQIVFTFWQCNDTTYREGGKVLPRQPQKKNRGETEMQKITITNDFTNRSTTVDASKPLTKARIKAIRRRLCSDDCCSGDDLGARGPQEDGYASLLNRAQHVIVSG